MIHLLAHLFAVLAIMQNTPVQSFSSNMAHAHDVYIKREFIGQEWACDPKERQPEMCYAGLSIGGSQVRLTTGP